MAAWSETPSAMGREQPFGFHKRFEIAGRSEFGHRGGHPQHKQTRHKAGFHVCGLKFVSRLACAAAGLPLSRSLPAAAAAAIARWSFRVGRVRQVADVEFPAHRAPYRLSDRSRGCSYDAGGLNRSDKTGLGIIRVYWARDGVHDEMPWTRSNVSTASAT